MEEEEEGKSSVGDKWVEESVVSVSAVSVNEVLVKAVAVKLLVSVKEVKGVPVREIEEDIAKSHCCHQMEWSHRAL